MAPCFFLLPPGSNMTLVQYCDESLFCLKIWFIMGFLALILVFKKCYISPGRPVHLVRASSRYTKVVGSIPGQGTY